MNHKFLNYKFPAMIGFLLVSAVSQADAPNFGTQMGGVAGCADRIYSVVKRMARVAEQNPKYREVLGENAYLLNQTSFRVIGDDAYCNPTFHLEFQGQITLVTTLGFCDQTSDDQQIIQAIEKAVADYPAVD